MLAKIADELPRQEGFLFEPKWDGFRAIVFRNGDEVYIQSRDLRPLNRYFPELERALAQSLPKGCVIDGEIVVAGAGGLDFDALQQRLHPASSRVARLASATPASFVAFDLLAAGGRSTMELPQAQRRIRLERLLGQIAKPVYLTPVTRDRSVAEDWLKRFEGAGLDGVIAKPETATYQPGKRAMLKIKHARTADCVVAGFRWYQGSKDAVGSLLLGLYNEVGMLQHVGVTSSFTMAMRRELADELAPLAQERPAGPSLARLGQRRRRREPHARRAEPLERRQGPVLGGAAARARLRSEIRPSAGRSLPPCRRVRALAPGQGAAGLPLRPARSDDAFRVVGGFFGGLEEILRSSRQLPSDRPVQ